jgi:hypothetical protein
MDNNVYKNYNLFDSQLLDDFNEDIGYSNQSQILKKD